MGLQVVDPHRGHSWDETDFIYSKPTYCNWCKMPVLRGSYCSTCGLCVHDNCLDAANKKHACKVVVLSRRNSMKHHWIRGNLPLTSICDVCRTHCGTEPRLCDLRCVWCQRAIHENCMKTLSRDCNFGKFQSMILPPYCITVKYERWNSAYSRYVVREVHPPKFKKWSPLLVLANRKSGEGEGNRLLKAFKQYLNPVQVVDLLEAPPESALDFCRLLPSHRCRILICGGDGTVGWVLGALDCANIKIAPHVAVLPLGTGNDLARVLGWGSGYTGEEEIAEILESVENAFATPLDRWQIRIDSYMFMHVPKPRKLFKMNNYFSVGVDATVVLKFHLHREKQPSLFSSRLLNKAIYFGYGVNEVLESNCKNLQEKIELELDGRVIELPELEGVVVLNINSWCAGVQMIPIDGRKDLPPVSFSDGKLEVCGLYSSFHIARMQVNLADPLLLGQARRVKIRVKEKCQLPMQIDGEPWEQGPGSLTITHLTQTIMLSNGSVT
ncbi:diacylglycerol kinase epsilon-like isoform X2 [Xenia sp. Carnegie-2017]|uniref:diacylglycerol kinase epsilon-like isoform X2 n=1 Tax=Xenia sp. Carnegie-2017 TaxID=2897299 RepID=UPI001F0496A8|nr:diacylglycerol kinase epsilon-like isoform X2 [Xenia sp. Carnegie-2017]